ncbi:MAG: nitronate monooxygenase [Clostridia bacterium]|nr:nitronate monooxygenase [Clostridia bacterium]
MKIEQDVLEISRIIIVLGNNKINKALTRSEDGGRSVGLKELKIGRIKIPIPIIQGGMAVRISTAPLAAAVANEGGAGIIAGTGMALDELRREIKKARKLSNGVIGVNVLFAVREFPSLVKAAMEEGIDLFISGAGFSRDMFSWGKKWNVPIVPIVSSAKLAVLAERLGASAVVAEGKEAGGHLGTDRPMKSILTEVRKAVKIPVIAAGGIARGKDIMEAMKLGADGVQIGTLFGASEESNASQKFKEMYIEAGSEDVVLIESPVGMVGRGLKSDLQQMIEKDRAPLIRECQGCLKRCSKKYCIIEALNNACRGGDHSKALIFAGEKVEEVKEILPAKKIFRNLISSFI